MCGGVFGPVEFYRDTSKRLPRWLPLTFADKFKPDGLRSKLNKCDLAFKVEHVAFKVEQ
jgi:hypothetical protein